MRKKILGVLVLVAALSCGNAYAANPGEALKGFVGGVGGFVYNALPWNWGDWNG